MHVISHRHLPYHTIPYHTTPYRHLPHHTIQTSTIPHHTIPYHTIPYRHLPYHTVQTSTTPYHTDIYHTIPYRTRDLVRFLRRRGNIRYRCRHAQIHWHEVAGLHMPIRCLGAELATGQTELNWAKGNILYCVLNCTVGKIKLEAQLFFSPSS